MGFRFGRWYLADEECNNVAVTVRGAERARTCGEAGRGREALALPQGQKARSRDYRCGGDDIKNNKNELQ